MHAVFDSNKRDKIQNWLLLLQRDTPVLFGNEISKAQFGLQIMHCGAQHNCRPTHLQMYIRTVEIIYFPVANATDETTSLLLLRAR